MLVCLCPFSICSNLARDEYFTTWNEIEQARNKELGAVRVFSESSLICMIHMNAAGQLSQPFITILAFYFIMMNSRRRNTSKIGITYTHTIVSEITLHFLT